MDEQAADLYVELQFLRRSLVKQFEEGHWTDLTATLSNVAKLGEGQGCPELCLRAQSLRELMGNRGSGRLTPGQRVEQLFSDLLFQLAHLQWSNQARC